MNSSDESLRALYQDIILDHYRKPRNRGEIEDATHTVHMNNPTCGDEIRLQLRLEDDRLAEIRFQGHGCSISQASASMMTALVDQRTIDEARQIGSLFTAMLHGGDEPPSADLRDARALAGVSRFPARVRCALLPWNALTQALDSTDSTVEPS